jgi:DNA-binding IclR family transcriptional regulator
VTEIRSLARGLQILDLLGGAREDVGVTELAGWLGVDKASASRLVTTLAHHGYLERDRLSRRYRLGPQLLALSRRLLIRLPLHEVAGPYLRRLMERTGECAHLGVAAQGGVLYIGQAEAPATLRVNVLVGQTAPLHCTALGKALLAFGGLPIPDRLERFTSRTITRADRLARELASTHGRGYAVDDEEFDVGVRCLAAPVFDHRSHVAGAIGISGPTTRMTNRRMPGLAETVRQTASELSERMGSLAPKLHHRREEDRARTG